MATVLVKFGGAGAFWAKACQDAVKALNTLFKQHGVKVTLVTSGSAATITVSLDPSIGNDAVHGKTSAAYNGNTMVSAEVRLMVKVTINTPQGVRDAGNGVREVIAAHEFVHALGHAPHNSKLMTQTFYKEPGDNANQDKLKTADGSRLPPITLSSESIAMLKGNWP